MLIQFLLVLISILVLNQCIDEIDFQPLVVSNSISYFNDLNSAVEYVSEVILGNKDAFPDYQKGSTHKQSSSIKIVSSKIYQPFYTQIIPFVFSIKSESPSYFEDNYSFNYSREINQPPNNNTI